MDEEVKDYELWAGEEMLAAASGPHEAAFREIMGYADQYAEEGEVRIYEIRRIHVLTISRSADNG